MINAEELIEVENKMLENKSKQLISKETRFRIYFVVNANNFVALDQLNHHHNKQLDRYIPEDRIE